ncbi:hybrid sensor histidine kinase/response regulator, partial [Myxococcota bacterium]|nr:hybrid sensor histidine kinase/response regulator [Myxococcota bacterium]
MNGDKARILVVDDDDAARYAVTRALRAEGHELLEAATGEAALTIAHATHPDLVVLDVHLPDMLGFDVAERLRAAADTQAVAVLMVSASFVGADAQALGLRRGADAYLTHPIEPQVLAATAQALLRMRSAEQLARDTLAERERLLTEAREATAQRDRLVAELREEAHRKNEFLAVLSHELRNPLAPIRNCLRILEAAEPGSELAQRARETIDRQARQLTRLVDDLLDVTRIERGKVRLQREHVDLAALVRRAVDDHRDLFAKAGLEVVARIPIEPMDFDGDPTRISQVIGNLLHNSTKFTPGGGQVWISLSREGPPERALLRVRDTGLGITPDTLAHLFEPFVQGDKTLDRSGGGLGLGLA